MTRPLLACSRLAALIACGSCALAALTQCTRTRPHSEGTTASPAATTEHTTFAALEGVPGLYLSHSAGWFPARGIAMNIDDQYAVLLWEFSFELIECTCI